MIKKKYLTTAFNNQVERYMQEIESDKMYKINSYRLSRVRLYTKSLYYEHGPIRRIDQIVNDWSWSYVESSCQLFQQ
jgi:hypothetical protein